MNENLIKKIGKRANIYSSMLADNTDEVLQVESSLINEYIRDAFIEGASFALAELQEAERWRSVEEELPKASYDDLLLKGVDSFGDEAVDVGYMHEPGTDVSNFISGYVIRVTHWKPIN